MVIVAQILKDKGSDVFVITPEVKVVEALKLMAEKGVGALMVVEKGEKGRVVGVISERDYARKVVLFGKSSADTPVKDIMTTTVYGVHPETKAEECMALMTDKHIRHLPVFEKDKLVGVVSIGDIVKSIIGEQKVMIDHLQDYIMGKYQ
jgi:CBS domain-containing protein